MRDINTCSVYRYYDRSGVLIYVGVTSRGIARNREHNRSRPWWPLVDRQEVDHLPDRHSALARERELIERYSPPFNTQHNADSARVLADYERYCLTPAAPEDVRREIGGMLPLLPTPSGFVTTPGVFGLARYCDLTAPFTRVIDADTSQVIGRLTRRALLPARLVLCGQVRKSVQVIEAVADVRLVPKSPRYMITRVKVRCAR